jgi:hypothetical protein
MTDRELLTLAAKAAGIEIQAFPISHDESVYYTEIPDHLTGGTLRVLWSPLKSDGDALRLAVKLGMCIDTLHLNVVRVYANNGITMDDEPGDYGTRRAIVKCAAEIGKAIP